MLRLKTCVCPVQCSWHSNMEKASKRSVPLMKTLDSCFYYVMPIHKEAPSVNMLAGQRTQYMFSADLKENGHLLSITNYFIILNLYIAFILLYKVTISKHFHIICTLVCVKTTNFYSLQDINFFICHVTLN